LILSATLASFVHRIRWFFWGNAIPVLDAQPKGPRNDNLATRKEKLKEETVRWRGLFQFAYFQ
jgi:hypothetical protein